MADMGISSSSSVSFVATGDVKSSASEMETALQTIIDRFDYLTVKVNELGFRLNPVRATELEMVKDIARQERQDYAASSIITRSLVDHIYAIEDLSEIVLALTNELVI